jgi:predicted alpha/beta hydrolase family esterase
VAAWAAHSKNAHLVKAALLVAPPDTAREDITQMLPGWTPALQTLPFAARVMASSNDPFCSLQRAEQLAAAWGAAFEDVGQRGHINSDSGLKDWPAAHAALTRLMRLNSSA